MKNIKKISFNYIRENGIYIHLKFLNKQTIFLKLK